MHPLTKWASKLYPKWWRERYGEEFAALLEDSRPGIGGALDIVKSAMAVQLQSWSPHRVFWSLGAAGLAVGIIAALSIQPQFTSQSVLSIMSSDPAAGTANRIKALSFRVLNQNQLRSLIQDLGVYSQSDEKAVEQMKRHIRVMPIQVVVRTRKIPAFAIKFDHPDRFVAQRVVSALNSRYIDANLSDRVSGSAGISLELLDPASLPANPNINRSSIAIGGAGTGLFSGALLAWSLHRRRANAKNTATRAWKFFRSASRMVTAGALGGLLTAAAWVAWKGPSYSSTATLSITGGVGQGLTQATGEIGPYVLNTSTLFDVMRKLDLYSAERNRQPLEDVVALMGRSLRVSDSADHRQISISFTYSDALMTKMTLDEFASRLLAANRRGLAVSDVPTLHLLAPATIAIRTDTPWITTASGGVAGLALGCLLALFSHSVRAQVHDRH